MSHELSVVSYTELSLRCIVPLVNCLFVPYSHSLRRIPSDLVYGVVGIRRSESYPTFHVYLSNLRHEVLLC